MAWWGKALGGAFGFMLGGPLGALMGIAFGHNFDRGLNKLDTDDLPPGQQERVQAAFFTATFSVMGHLAKADGQVTRDEIERARQIMLHLGLDEQMQDSAKKLFNEGKQDAFPLDQVLDQFKIEVHRRSTLIQMFLQILLQMAYADGQFDAAEEKVLIHVCQRLGIPLTEFQRLEEMVRAGMSGNASSSSSFQHSIDDAYSLLGVEQSASDSEVKRAYRRLMSQNHPDKLVAKGLPEEMIKLATEKTQQIKSAYEAIKKHRA